MNVLKTYKNLFPEIILGLSDHTPGSTTVLGAIALGAKMIEKHFTDDNNRDGPDHAFSMNPKSWKEMIQKTKELESAMGVGIKKIEENEMDTCVLQRRSLRASKNFKINHLIQEDDFVALRPCPVDAVPPYEDIIGKSLKRSINKGDYLKRDDI